MNKNRLKQILSEFKETKRELGFTVVDSHFHPFDVMGVLPPHSHEYLESEDDSIKHELPFNRGPLEIFKYDRFAKAGTKIAFDLLPGFIARMITDTYKNYNYQNLLNEMETTGTDRVCLLPVEPWVRTKDVVEKYKNNRMFYLVGSIDIHNTDPEDIAPILHKYKEEYGVVGLKLHANLQGFHPLPSKNNKKIEELLKQIYSGAEREGLYLQFHGGTSFYTKKVHSHYKNIRRSKDSAIIENFINEGSEQELLGVYDVPIIIAHAASYGVFDVDMAPIKKAVKLHPKLFFDTSGVSPRIISKILKNIGAEYIVYGSDGPYNRMACNIGFLWEAIVNTFPKEERPSIIKKTFGENFLRKVLQS